MPAENSRLKMTRSDVNDAIQDEKSSLNLANGNGSPVKLEGTQSTMQGLSKLASSHASVNTSGVAAMMRQLDQIQAEQIAYQRKIELEKKRKIHFETALQEQRDKLKYYRDITKSGRIVKDDDMVSKKMITKLEYQLAQARDKLSGTRKENAALKITITELRQEKNFHVNILAEVKSEIEKNTVLLQQHKDEINVVNNKKQRTDVELANMQVKMCNDLDIFSDELQQAKRTVIETQASILEGIRDKLQSTFSPVTERRERRSVHQEVIVDNSAEIRAQKLSDYLKEVQVGTLEELIVVLQKSEESIFSQYNEIQSLTQETEKLEIDNKHLEKRLEDELINVQKLEESSDSLRIELDQKVSLINRNIDVYDKNFARNMETLNNCKEGLQGLLRNISQEEDSADQALLATGVTDRNLPEYLGKIEQRIDEVIQILKAAKRERLNRADFVRATSAPGQARVHPGNRGGDLDDGASYSQLRVPILPSFHDADDEEDHAEVLPVDISMLKNMMAKKLSNGLRDYANAEKNLEQEDNTLLILANASSRTNTPRSESISRGNTPRAQSIKPEGLGAVSPTSFPSTNEGESRGFKALVPRTPEGPGPKRTGIMLPAVSKNEDDVIEMRQAEHV